MTANQIWLNNAQLVNLIGDQWNDLLNLCKNSSKEDNIDRVNEYFEICEYSLRVIDCNNNIKWQFADLDISFVPLTKISELYQDDPEWVRSTTEQHLTGDYVIILDEEEFPPSDYKWNEMRLVPGIATHAFHGSKDGLYSFFFLQRAVFEHIESGKYFTMFFDQVDC